MKIQIRININLQLSADNLSYSCMYCHRQHHGRHHNHHHDLHHNHHHGRHHNYSRPSYWPSHCQTVTVLLSNHLRCWRTDRLDLGKNNTSHPAIFKFIYVLLVLLVCLAQQQQQLTRMTMAKRKNPRSVFIVNYINIMSGCASMCCSFIKKKQQLKPFEPSVEPQKYKTYFLSSWKIIIFFCTAIWQWPTGVD